MAEPDDIRKKKSLLISQFLQNSEPIFPTPVSHLEPEDSPFSAPGMWEMGAYHQILAQSLLGAIDLDPHRDDYKEVAMMFCLPSFESEWALCISGSRKTGFEVALAEPATSIWYSTFRKDTPSDPAAVRLGRAGLTLDRGGAICDLWKQILLKTRYSTESCIGCDGVTYHFTYWSIGKTPMCGKIWSPGKETIPGKLAALALSLKDYVRDPDNQDVFENAMDEQIADLWSRSK
jgi:hypothetical protein